MIKVVFVAVFGLLPAWGAAVVVWLGSRQTNVSPDYWNVAPWLVIAALPFCAITLAIAAATIYVFNGALGGTARKLRVAGVWFLALNSIAVLLGSAAWWNNQRRKHEAASNEALAVEFVSGNAAAIMAAGGKPNFSLASQRIAQDGTAIEYDVAVEGEKTVYAIVRTTQTDGRPTFKLACITHLSLGYRESNKDSCTSSTPQVSK